ncbi:MAG: endopeptidase La [Bacteroidaceae bacterium]|nr:endopeptidase La [Bacteroidaceae bacterium]
MKRFEIDMLSSGGEGESFSMIADFEGNEENLFNGGEFDSQMPVLPLRNMVLFPGTVMPVTVGRVSSLRLVRDAYKKESAIAVLCQKSPETESPTENDLYDIGTAARVVRVFEMPDQTTTVILQGMQRVRLRELVKRRPYLTGVVEPLREELPAKDSREFRAIVDNCKDLGIKYARLNADTQQDTSFALKNIHNGIFIVNYICTNLPFEIREKMQLLQENSLQERAIHLLSILNREVQLSELKQNIQMRTKEEIDQQQREYFLMQQMKNIQDELGGSVQDQDIEEMRSKAAKKLWNDDVAAIFEKEVQKLERTNPQSPDYNVQLNYLQTMLSLPWNEYTNDNLDMNNAQHILDRDHYGLEKVKERIIEHLAVLKLRGNMKSPIICLYGPPGVGKTSLGKSIADALGRKYVRISLGGVHDEAEIRGHRKTYIGAMPGRIIKGLQKAGSSNPVFILDEVDKISQMTNQGDPSSALLEVLDPEQNSAFHDNFLDVDFDLSHVMFIATANNLNTIPAPLLDRMELIEMSGYLTEEKVEIASHHLVRKQIEENGIPKRYFSLSKPALELIIENYTRESGVRELDKKIGKICRRIAYEIARDGASSFHGSIRAKQIPQLLGVQEYSRDRYEGNNYAGVVTGLAWTAVGGEILFIETSLSKGKGGKLTLTGNLGDVMKESATIALEYVKAHAAFLDIDPTVFENWNIHLHVPEGAIPKDGPSAGITMATALASAFTQRKVRPNLAMTGEITLRGKVLPVGGIKEKILAAKRAGITDIILCKENQRNISEIQPLYLHGLTFHYVDDIREVWKIALLPEKVNNPIDLSAKLPEKES